MAVERADPPAAERSQLAGPASKLPQLTVLGARVLLKFSCLAVKLSMVY